MTGRNGLLLAGLIAVAVMALFSFTRLVWVWMGRPAESYPELFFFVLGLPQALIATFAGALVARGSARRSAANLSGLRLVGTLALMSCAALIGIYLSPLSPIPTPLAQGVVNFLGYGELALGAALITLAAAPLFGRPAQGEEPR